MINHIDDIPEIFFNKLKQRIDLVRPLVQLQPERIKGTRFKDSEFAAKSIIGAIITAMSANSEDFVFIPIEKSYLRIDESLIDSGSYDILIKWILSILSAVDTESEKRLDRH